MSVLERTSVVYSGRGMGKTYVLMNLVHEQILAGRNADIIVVFPNMARAEQWQHEWRTTFSGVPMPLYTTAANGNLVRVRGRYAAKVFIEDITEYEEGIYDEKLFPLWHCLKSARGLEDIEVVVSCSPISMNTRAHSQVFSKDDVLKRIRPATLRL